MFLEIELKLALAKENVPLLFDHPFLKLHPLSPPQYLVSTYFDTSNHILWNNKFSVRIRQDNNKFIQTVKTAGEKEGHLHHRYEWEDPLDSTLPNLEILSDAPLRQTLRNLLADRPLIELFTTQFNRTQWTIELNPDNVIELVLDQGLVTNGVHTLPIHEIEIELKRGNKAALNDLAELLGKTIPLEIEKLSKAERGYSLCKKQV